MNIKNYIISFGIFIFSFSFSCGLEEATSEVGNYKDGKKDGKWISYCEHENKIQEGNYKDGEKQGKWVFYLEDGPIWYEENYVDGIEHGEFILYGYGNYNIFHKLKLENKKDGKLDGKSIHYHVNGAISRILNYKNGEQNGTNIFYDKNGQIYWHGNYKDGELIDGDFVNSDKPLNLY
jgi:antitoxin component YwqK of YwqJK toxin-antitoxin module